jgi:hypothetical protein
MSDDKILREVAASALRMQDAWEKHGDEPVTGEAYLVALGDLMMTLYGIPDELWAALVGHKENGDGN